MNKRKNTAFLVMKIIAIVIISVAICIGYARVFVPSFIPQIGSKKYLAVTRDIAKNNVAKFGDVFVVSKVEELYELKSGDKICFRRNDEILIRKVDSIVTTAEGYRVKTAPSTLDDVHILKFDNIIGKVDKKVAGFGFVLFVTTTYSGVGLLSLLLLCVVCIDRFVAVKKYKVFDIEAANDTLSERKYQKSIKKLGNETTAIDAKMIESALMNNDSEKNKAELKALYDGYDTTISVIWCLALRKLHNEYMFHDVLNANQQKVFSNLIEIFGVVDHINMSIEYKIVDLLVKSRVSMFDDVAFLNHAVAFFNKPINNNDLLHFMSIMYGLIATNNKISRKVVDELICLVEAKSEQLNIKTDFVFIGLYNSIVNKIELLYGK